MTLTNTVVAKFAVAFVAIAMAFSAFAPAQAQTADELQATIDALMAQIAELNAQMGTGDSMMSSSCASIPAPLTLGSQNANVMALQNFLMGEGESIPAGPTDYFGSQTQAALASWQAKNGVAPAVGYYGPITKAAIDAKCATMDDGGDMDDGDDEGEDEDEDEDEGDLEGEGTLGTFEMDEEEDEVQEGAEEYVIATLTMEAEDGDIEMSRITMTVADAGGDTNDEEDPWDVFDEFSLMVDGEKVAEFDASDEDEYLDEDIGEFRFSNLGLILREDDEVEVEFAVSVANSVDGADDTSSTDSDWTFTATEVRYFDADDVATNDDTTDELPSASSDVEVVEEGIDDKAEVASNSDDPDAATLEVDDGTSDSDEETIFIFDIEVDEDSSDLTVGDAFIDITVANASTTGAVAGGVEDIIKEVFLTIDGTTEEGEDTATLDDYDATLAASGSNEVRFKFEFDHDVELESDTDYEVTVSVVFEGQDGNYDNGDITVTADVDGTTWEVEGLADDNELEGTQTGETHTLATVVPTVTDVDDTVTADDPNDSGTISFEFTVGADTDDVTFDVADNSDVQGGSDDVRFTITGTDTSIGTTTLTLIDGDATFAGGTWTINEDDEATFALDTSFATVDAGDDGTYRVTLDSVAGVEVDETSNGLSLSN